MKKMRTLLLLCTAFVFAVACQNNYSNNTASDKVAATHDSANFTKIEWLDTAKDLGTITEGQKVEVSFRFRNVGNKPLVIERVQPSCGCTVADPPKEPIPAGQQGVIKGVFDSNGKVGPNHKTLYVYANTTPSQEHALVFNVVVNKKEK